MLRFFKKIRQPDKKLTDDISGFLENSFGEGGVLTDNDVPWYLQSKGNASFSLPVSRPSKQAVTSSEAIKSLEEILKSKDVSFAEAVENYMIVYSIEAADVYKNAHMSRQAFHRILNNPDTGVTKKTALALSVGLRLDVGEASDFLGKAGYSLSKSDKTDLIVAYCLKNRIYDMMKINDILDFFGLKPLAL